MIELSEYDVKYLFNVYNGKVKFIDTYGLCSEKAFIFLIAIAKFQHLVIFENE
jgi:hypothetical protein